MASIKYNNVYIDDWYTITGPLESDSKLKKYDKKIKDYYYGEKSFEQAQIKMGRECVNGLLKQNNLEDNNIDLIVGGDLLDQLTATDYACSNIPISLLGIFSACATFVEGLIVSSNFMANRSIKRSVVMISSHNKSIERQFRYPIEYGIPRKKVQTFTSTGSTCVLLGKEPSKIKIESATIGKVIEYGINDANNMGAIMAPAAANTLKEHLNDLKRDIKYYDLIMTGDLGCVGSVLFKELLEKTFNIKLEKYIDAGCELFLKSQDVDAGGSGPTCLPLVLFNKVLLSKKHKKILIIGTGALHSRTTANQKLYIPAIAHAVSLEVI